MISKYKLTLIAAVASMGIASPAFAQSAGLPFSYDAQGGRHSFTYGYSQTTAPDLNQTVAPQRSREQIAARQSGLHAFAEIDGGHNNNGSYNNDSGYNNDGSYNRSGYDPGIEVQR